MLEIGENGRTWILSGPTSSYAVHLTEDDELLHLHWGPRIVLADAEALTVGPLPDYWPFESPLDGREEYPVEGGPRFVRPALSVRTDGRRGTEWVFEAYERAEDDELRLQVPRRRPHRSRCTTGMRHDVVERWVRLDNEGPRRGAAARRLRHLDPARPRDRLADVAPARPLGRGVPAGARTPHLRREGHRQPPRPHRAPAPAVGRPGHRRDRGARRGLRLRPRLVRILADRRGRNCPTRACRSPAARVRRLRPAPAGGGRVLHRPGLRRAVERRRLRRGEPRLARLPAGVRHPGRRPGPAGAVQLLGGHRASTSPRSSRGRWPAGPRRSASSCSSSTTAGSAQRTSDRAGLGDWTPNPDRFPDGLKPLADDVHDLGMQFGIWVEPEMVNPDSDLYRAHPDWVQYQPGRKRTELRNQLVLNLAREDVQEYLWERLARAALQCPDRLREVGLQPLLHRRGLARGLLPAAPVDRSCERAVRACSTGCGPGPPGRRLRVLLGRRRPDRPRCPVPYRPGVDLRQHRPARPARHPARVQPDPPRASDGRLGHRQPQHPAQQPGQHAAVPVRQRHGRGARGRRGPCRVDRGGARRGRETG